MDSAALVRRLSGVWVVTSLVLACHVPRDAVPANHGSAGHPADATGVDNVVAPAATQRWDDAIGALVAMQA